MNEQNLAQVQNWFTTLLVTPGSLAEKMARAGEEYQLKAHEWIKGDARVPLETRLGVYATGYMLRLLECMQADLPSLYAFWGPALFDLFGKAYLWQQPSRLYSLHELTAGFADFLDRTRPATDSVEPEKQILYDIPSELVRMERARLAAMLAKGTENTPVTGTWAFFSFFSGAQIQLRAHPALQLLSQKMPLVDFYGQLVQGQEMIIPGYGTSYLAVTRLGFRVRFHTLSHWQFYFLQYLQAQNHGVDLQDAVHYVCIQTSLEKAELLATVCLWLPNAVEMGLLLEN